MLACLKPKGVLLMYRELRLTYFLHQHVEVLRVFGGEACKNLSVSRDGPEQRHIMRRWSCGVYCFVASLSPVQTGSSIPFDFRMRSILLPAKNY